MLPVLFKIGSFELKTWGFSLLVGFLLAAWRAGANARRYNLSKEDFWDAALIGLAGGVVGGRLAFVLLNWAEFSEAPQRIFALWEGGMTSFGGLILGPLAALVFCRLRKLDGLQILDLAAVSFPIGYGIGRIGCFLNGCCYGGLCPVPDLAVPMRWDDGITRASHPAQLYSALASVVMYLILVNLEKRRQFKGQLILAFAGLYAVYRFLIEFVREGATAQATAAQLTQGQIACLVIAVLTALLYIVLQQRAKRTPQDAPVAA